jgi:EAL domain-containing protein (putative c-di-GMP-specific phosphodiesterase class I)
MAAQDLGFRGGVSREEGYPPLNTMRARPRPRIEIDEPLRHGWFEMWYQPKIDLQRKCLAGAEALARLRHPRFGVLPPGSFLPDVGEGSVQRLAEHVLIAALTGWTILDREGFSVLVEVPIPAIVGEHRPRSERWPGIILAVTEDQIARNVRLAQDIAGQLRTSGVDIAIDDFGAGYSSFSTLRGLPFTQIKLDESFVKNCATDATNAAICQTAIDLAHRFGSAAVAQGIERAADMHALMVMGCDLGQGMLIGSAMPEGHFLELLRRRLNSARPPAQTASMSMATPTP